MSRQLIAVALAAVVLFVAAVAGGIALTGEDPAGGGTIHTMPDGSTMTGPMDEGMDMDDGSMMDDGMGMSP
jgi:hypothetical protein